MNTERLIASDGVALALHRLAGASGRTALLLPGTFSNSTFWTGTRGTGFARELAARGWDVRVLDFRGHGASQPAARRSRWTFHDWIHRDAVAALDALSERERFFLIGHSAGGAVALLALAAEPRLRHRIAGVVVIATPVPWGQRWGGVAARAAGLLTRALGRFPAKWLGLGPEDEQPRVVAQWMGWNARRRWSAPDGRDYTPLLAGLDMPMLFLAGAGDRTEAPPAGVRALAGLVGSRDLTFRVCGRDTGFAEDFDHTTLVVSRAARAEVWPIILEWLERRASA